MKKYVTLGEVCVKESSNIAQKDIEHNNGSYGIYGASGYIKDVDFYQQDKPYIAVVKDGAGIGRTMLLPAKTSVIGTMQYLVPNDLVSVEYLYYAVTYMNLSKYFTGATIPHIYFKDYQKEQLPLPSIKEQQIIVRILQKVDYLIELSTTVHNKLDLLVKSRFVEMFGIFKINSKGWKVEKFTDIAVIDGNMTTDFEKYADYPHIGIDSIEKGTGELKGYRTVKADNVVSGKYIFTPNHIIYSKIRPNLNKVALPDFDGVCSADAYPILPISEKCNREFLAYVMRSDYFLDYILQFCTRTNLPKVNRKEISGFSTPLPPLQLQHQFAAFVKQTDKSKYCIRLSAKTLCKIHKILLGGFSND
ncbi:MAG: restriction endonuclease subunit S [Ruminococcus sp.]|nr:restriction endonuclease subunit S [Ruminococcus sp.]